MKAGRLDQRISIETPSSTEDALGQDSLSWVHFATVHAEVMEGLGKEFLSGDYKAQQKVVFRIRWVEADSTMRVQWDDRIWRIENVTGTKRSRWQYLHCIAQDGAN